MQRRERESERAEEDTICSMDGEKEATVCFALQGFAKMLCLGCDNVAGKSSKQLHEQNSTILEKAI